MKIEYDVNLYKKIANFKLNKIVRVKNRNNIESTIHIQNITSLSWHDLQLLTRNGADRFSKMVFLYEKYSNSSTTPPPTNGDELSKAESEEISQYIKIYHSNNFTEHHQVNNFISENNFWNQFSTIRSLNDHGQHKEIKGIQPKYFNIICQLLKISGGNGLPLDSYKKY